MRAKDPRKYFQEGDHVALTVTDRTADGQGVGVLEAGGAGAEGRSASGLGAGAPTWPADFAGLKVFVAGALPGDRVICRVRRVKKGYLEGDLETLLEPADSRIQPPCPYAGLCDGCGLIAMTRQAQLALKKDHLEQQLIRLGGLNPEAVAQLAIPVHAQDPFHYRNKVNLRVSADGKLAYSQRGSHRRVEVDQCLVAAEPLSRLMAAWNARPLAADLASAVRMVVLRANRAGETMIVLVVDRDRKGDLEAIFRSRLFLQPKVLAASLNRSQDGDRLQEKLVYATPDRELEEQLLGLTFKVSPPSFFQVNSAMAEVLYTRAMAALAAVTASAPTGGVLDLYCGTGTTSLLLAQTYPAVIGVELSASAVRDAQVNARRNGIQKARFIQARAEDLIRDMTEKHPDYDRVLVDPPRAGLDEKVVAAIGQSQVRRMAYISCNPATLARDVRLLTASGFRLAQAEAFDMFPMTDHIEALALLVRK